MAFVYKDRVRESWSGTGTGDIVLGGAPDGSYEAFGDAGVMSDGDITDIEIFGAGDYESCQATYVASGNKLMRGTPTQSSNGGAAVNFGAGTKIVIMTLPASKARKLVDALGAALKWNVAPHGRLTLASATPVMTSSQAAKTTLYYTAYAGGNLVPIYDGVDMIPTAITGGEISALTTDTTKSPAAIGASKVNDWFVWNDAGTLRLSHGPDWTSDTARSAGTALTKVNGIWLNNASITNGPAASRGTYVGTTRSNASSQLDWIVGGSASGGTAGFLGVWNAYNRRPFAASVFDSGSGYSYSSSTIRQARGSAGNQVTVVVGLSEDALTATYQMEVGMPTSANVSAKIGIGYDTTTALSSTTQFYYSESANGPAASRTAAYTAMPSIGVHVVSGNEAGSAGGPTMNGTSDARLDVTLPM